MKKLIQMVAIMLTLALFIGACLPAASEQQNPQVQNTQSLDTQSQINTAGGTRRATRQLAIQLPE
jgi:PBP1b-binding outer membrane lipoprotein LpoB